MKILLAADGSPSSEAAIQQVASRHWPAAAVPLSYRSPVLAEFFTPHAICIV